jgi:hypothetical protein
MSILLVLSDEVGSSRESARDFGLAVLMESPSSASATVLVGCDREEGEVAFKTRMWRLGLFGVFSLLFGCVRRAS